METIGFSLDFFQESADGDDKFMKYILNLTARELQVYFTQLAEALQENNTEKASRAVHKLRPHLEALQAAEMEALIKRLINASDATREELLQAFQQKAALLCSAIQQAANHEK